MKILTTATIENLKKQIETEKLDAEQELNELKDTCELKKEMVDQERVNFTKIKKGAALKSYSTQTGKPLTGKELEALLDRERQKELEVISVRIENLKLNNQLKKKNRELRSKEEFGEGLHMIDFEQLKIENQTYNEKIEERNEELMKLKKKINNTVQILSHVKEKLQFVTKENEKEKDRLSVYDNQVKNVIISHSILTLKTMTLYIQEKRFLKQDQTVQRFATLGQCTSTTKRWLVGQ